VNKTDQFSIILTGIECDNFSIRCLSFKHITFSLQGLYENFFSILNNFKAMLILTQRAFFMLLFIACFADIYQPFCLFHFQLFLVKFVQKNLYQFLMHHWFEILPQKKITDVYFLLFKQFFCPWYRITAKEIKVWIFFFYKKSN